MRVRLLEFRGILLPLDPLIVKPQNRRMSNRRISKEGIAARHPFYQNKSIEFLPSTFDIRHSLFDIYPPLEDSLL
jgi:hypothetical protein